MTRPARHPWPPALGLTLAVLATSPPARPQEPDWAIQRFEVSVEPARVTLGDSVTLRFRVHLHERDLLADSLPRPVADLPEGVRVLAVEPFRQAGPRTLDGRARIAFYRLGRRAVPAFGIPFVRIVSGQRGLLVSESVFAWIDSVAPSGNPPLKDIKEIERRPRPDALIAGALAALGLAAGPRVVEATRAIR